MAVDKGRKRTTSATQLQAEVGAVEIEGVETAPDIEPAGRKLYHARPDGTQAGGHGLSHHPDGGLVEAEIGALIDIEAYA